MHACDGQTDGRTEFSSLDRVCIACSAVKMKSKAVRTTAIKPRNSSGDELRYLDRFHDLLCF